MQQPITNIAISAARNASRVLLRALDKLESISSRLERITFVTELHEQALAEITSAVNKSYPDHKIFSESGEFSASDFVWHIAIDGLFNYTYLIPHFAVTIAVKNDNCWQHEVIYEPIRQEIFYANRGRGAFLNRRRIRVCENKDLDTAILAVSNMGFPNWLKADRIYCNGASSLDFSYVAAGRFDGFWCDDVQTAGLLLIQEAGGLLKEWEENGKKNIFVASPKIFKELLNN